MDQVESISIPENPPATEEVQSNIVELGDDLKVKLEILNKALTDDVKMEIVKNMIPPLVATDSHGRSHSIVLKVHPAIYYKIKELFQYHKIKFKYLQDYTRYLLTIGLIIDRAYYDALDEDTMKLLKIINEINKKAARADLQMMHNNIVKSLTTLKQYGVNTETVKAIYSTIQTMMRKI